MKLKALIIAATLASAVTAWAVPPEGMEAYSLSGGRAGPAYLYAFAGYDKPSWTTDYETLESWVSYPTKSGNYFTFGGNLTAGNKVADRDIYFGRFDWIFWGQSLSFKAAHEDLRFIPAGKNVLSVDYNTGFHIGASTAFYFSGGIYYRYNLNSWNTPTWSPANYNTDDRDSFIEVCFGARIQPGAKTFFTLDLNNRDPFLSYNGDDLAFDVTVNIVSTPTLTWRLVSSSRFSGLLVGTADLGEQQFLLGFITTF